MIGNKKKGINENITGFLGQGVALSGRLNFKGSVRIDGKYEGEIDAEGTVIIGTDAVVNARINIDSAIIMGDMRGSIEAREKVEIYAQGKLIGDITTPRLVINDGAVFEGNCIMDSKKEDAVISINKDIMEMKVVSG
ncbi:MAG: polymer-forming cytoskeletal protein [Thermodesulfobacteriota bacterium]